MQSLFYKIEKKAKEYYGKKSNEMAPTPLDETKDHFFELGSLI